MALSSNSLRNYWSPRCRGPWATITLHGGGQVQVRPGTIEAVKAMNSVLQRTNYRVYRNQTGAQNCRWSKGKSGGWSLHAYGIALDLNWLWNPFGGSRHHIPTHVAHAITSIRTNNGRQVWTWGGDWSGTRDWMHFQIACTPGDLATGINWSTVSGAAPAPPKPPTPPDWKALRRLAAAQLIDGVKRAPNMGPGHTGPGAYGADMYVAVIQKALNLVTGTQLKTNGIYDAWTEGVIGNFQNFVRNTIKGKMPDPQGHFREYTRFYLAAALQNIKDGKA